MASSINKYTVVESLNQMIYESATVVTAVDGGSGATGDQTLDGSHTALYVGVGGDAVLTLQSGSDATFKNLASGQILPVKFTAIKATNTTATNMLALK
jgi:hypothetical protein